MNFLFFVVGVISAAVGFLALATSFLSLKTSFEGVYEKGSNPFTLAIIAAIGGITLLALSIPAFKDGLHL